MSESAQRQAATNLHDLTHKTFANMKVATPDLEELQKAASKYHAAMEQANAAATVFAEALAKVARSANQSKGATYELSRSMQKVASTHHKIVADRVLQATKMQTQFIVPLQKRLRAETKSHAKMEDDFKSMTKQYNSDVKKASTASIKAKKKADRSKPDTDKGEKAQDAMERAMQTAIRKEKSFEAFNQRCLRACLIEERRRYCYLMDNYASVFEDDFRAFGEERLIKELLRLCQEPEELPEESLQVIAANGSNGLMFEVAKEDERSLRNIEPSPLTKELAQRFHTDAQLLPPGCPPGGLGSFEPNEDQVRPSSRSHSARSRRSP